MEEGLECLECGVQWDLKATTDRLNLRGLDKDGGGKLSNELKDRLIRLLADQLSLAHRLTCIWRKHHTPRNVTRWLLAKHPQNSVQLSPIAMNINKRFFELAPDQVVENGVVEVVHPLVSRTVDQTAGVEDQGPIADDSACRFPFPSTISVTHSIGKPHAKSYNDPSPPHHDCSPGFT